jgi:hypothetical protein
VNLKVFVEKMGVPDDQAQQVIVSQHASTNVSEDQPTVNLGKWVCVLWKVDISFCHFGILYQPLNFVWIHAGA